MSIKVDILQGGTNNHGVTVDDLNAFATDFLVDGIVGTISSTAGLAPTTGGFAINQNGTPGKNVVVSAGTAYITGTPTDGVSQRLRVVSDTSNTVTISDNISGATKYDWIYIKLDPAKMKTPSVNADDVATLITSRSTSSSTDNGTPPTYGYCIAVVTVANNFTTITNANISDKRVQTYPTIQGPWTSWTPVWTGVDMAKATTTGSYIKIGKTVHFRAKLVITSNVSPVTARIDLDFPIPAKENGLWQSYGWAYQNTINYWQVFTIQNGYTTMMCMVADTSVPTLTWKATSPTVPMTWQATPNACELYISGTYEAE